MTEQRLIIEMGMGNTLHTMDYTKAARRAIQDALRHSSLPILGNLDISPDDMQVQVTVGVQDPNQVDCAALESTLPRGKATVTAVVGGLNTTDPATGDTNVIASAAVEVFLPKQTGWRLRND